MKKKAIRKTKKRWKEEHRKLYRAADVHGSWKKEKYTSFYWCQSGPHMSFIVKACSILQRGFLSNVSLN